MWGQDRCTFFEKSGGDGIGIRLLVRQFESILWISDTEAGLKLEKSGGVVEGEGECGDDVVWLLSRDRRSLDILSVKKEEKLSASEIPGAQEGNVEGELQCRSLLTVCQSRLGLSEDDETRLK